MVFTLLIPLINSILYDYSIENSSLKILFTEEGDEVTQKDVYAHAPILEMQYACIGDGIESIGESAFADYSKMHSISFGFGVKIIKSMAFIRCYSLRSIIFPNSLKTLEDESFSECVKLENITIPASLTNITSSLILRSADSLSCFFIPYGNSVFSTSPDNTILIKDTTTAFIGPGLFNIVNIPDNIIRINSKFLYGRSNVRAINFGTAGNLRYIDDVSLAYSSISEFIFPEGLHTIGSAVFEGSKVAVQKIVIPSTVVQVGYIFTDVKEIIIHENCTGVHQCEDGTIYNGNYTQILLFPKTLVQYKVLKSITAFDYFQLKKCENLINLTVEENHSVYSDYNNGLYNVEKTRLHIISGGITSISIAPQCQIIGHAALSLPKLSSIIFEGSNVAIFEQQSLQSIAQMETMTIPEGVTYIGRWAFDNNKTPLIVFPSSLNTLSDYSFNKAGITKADLSQCNNLKTIPGYCFSKCAFLEAIVLPKSLEVISINAFEDCKELVSVNITEKIHTLDSCCFQNCMALSKVNIQSNVALSIGSKAFSNCGITQIEFGKGTSVIYQNAFSNNPGIEELSFDDDCMLSEILTEAFIGCNNLKKLRFGNNLTKVYPGAFAQMDSLQDIFVSEGNTFYHSINGILFSANEETLVAFPGGRSNCDVRQPTKFIGEKAFYKCRLLKDLKFDENAILEEINGYTFAGCSNLSTIKLPASLKSISSYGFEGCSSLTKVKFNGESKLQTLKSDTFSGCVLLESVLFEPEASLVTIEKSVFCGFKHLKTFRSPPSLRKIESEAFAECINLDSINVSNVEEYGERCFQGCILLYYIKFSPLLKTLSKDSFRNCKSLQVIVYCGRNNFDQNSFDGVQTLAKVMVGYSYDKFGGLGVWRLLDIHCQIATEKFTVLMDQSISPFFLEAFLLSEPEDESADFKNFLSVSNR